MASYYPNGEKINGESYDYAQSKPTDISFSNPEKYDEKITNELFTGSTNTFDEDGISSESSQNFTGPTCRLTPAVFMPSSPRLSKSPERSTAFSTSPTIADDHYKSPPTKDVSACPLPPPRPEHTKKQTRCLGPRYEVSEIDAGAVGIYLIPLHSLISEFSLVLDMFTPSPTLAAKINTWCFTEKLILGA